MEESESNQPSILSQDRKQMIMEKLKQERQQRKQEFLKKTQQTANSPIASEQQLENPNINQNNQNTEAKVQRKPSNLEKNMENLEQNLDWNNIVNMNTDTMRKINNNQNQNQNNAETKSKSHQLSFNIQKYQNKFKNQLNNLDPKIISNSQQNDEVNQYIDNLIKEQQSPKNINTQQGKQSLRNSQIQLTQEEAIQQYKQLQQNNLGLQQKANIFDYPQLSKASPQQMHQQNVSNQQQQYIQSPSSTAKSGKFYIQNNQINIEDNPQQNNLQQQQFQQFQEEQKGFWSHKKKIAENQYLNVKRLMFGHSSNTNSQRQTRSRSNDSEIQQQQTNKFRKQNPYYFSNKKSTKRYCSQSPSHRKNTIQDISNIDFEFQDQNPEHAKLINDLIIKHGYKQGHEKITEFQRRTEEEYINQQKFPFKPKINELPRDIYNWDEKQKLEISKEQQWDRILITKKDIQEEREILKIQQDAQYIKENCTFKPEINQISNLLTKRDKYQQNISERLYQQGLEKVRQIDKISLKQKAEQEFLQNHPFKPDVVESVSKLTTNAAYQKPLFQRIDEVIKEKQDQKLQLQMQYSEQQKHPFKPQINETSQKIHEYKAQTNQLESKNFIERMMKDAVRKLAQKQMNEELAENQLSEQCTFKPSLVATKNEEILENNVFFQQETDFIKRQQLMQDYINEKLDLKKNEIKKQNSYKPQINQISKYLVETDEQRALENQEEKFIRLAIKDREKKEIIKEQLQKAYYDQYSYKPKLNSISKQLGNKHNLDELTDIKTRNEKINQKKAEIEQQQLQECSFKPQTNKKKKFEHLKSKYSVKQDNNISVNLQDTQLEKEKKKEQLKQIIEYEEMKECTFKPQTNQNFSKNENVQVRGMDKYMQYRQLHKKQKMEQKEREVKIFNLERNYDLKKHSKQTQLQEFQLSKNNPKKMQLLMQEQLEREKEVCTFQPQTNESKNKAMIKKILEEQNQNQIQQQQQFENQENQEYYNNNFNNNQQESISQNFNNDMYKIKHSKENIEQYSSFNPQQNSNFKFSQNDIILNPYQTGQTTQNNFFQQSANNFQQQQNNQQEMNFEKPDIQKVKEWMKKQDILTDLEKQFKIQPSPEKENQNYEQIHDNYKNSHNTEEIIQQQTPENQITNIQQFQYQVFRPNVFGDNTESQQQQNIE